jgi:hypothetical protein
LVIVQQCDLPGPPCLSAFNALQLTAENTSDQINKAELQKLIDNYQDVFPNDLPNFQPVPRNIPHTIPLLNEAKPVCRPMYTLSQST